MKDDIASLLCFLFGIVLGAVTWAFFGSWIFHFMELSIFWEL